MPINKPKITPGQGLLLLIAYYQDDSTKLIQLKKLYLSGAKDVERCIELCDAMLDEPLLENYDIAIDEKSIDSDPSRRYFETHLAYQTLKHQLGNVDIHDINDLYQASAALVDQNISQGKRETINQVFKGECTRPSFKKKENYQYNAYIKRLKEGSIFPEFPAAEREKIKWLVRVIYMAMVNGWQSTKLPLDIYHTEHFSTNARGKIMRGDEMRSTRNQSFGLLKGHMPLAVDDIAVSKITFEHIKSTDYATFDSDSAVVQACFQQLVHPFSNSISGCFLVNLRVLAQLHNNHRSNSFTESLEDFIQIIRLMISSALYYSGGHTLYEYAAVLMFPEVQEFFQYMLGFSELNLENIFYHGNESAFDEALAATIAYNARLLKKNALHSELYISRYVFFKNAVQNSCRPYVTESPISVTALGFNIMNLEASR